MGWSRKRSFLARVAATMGPEGFQQGMLCLHKSSQYLFFACSRIEITGRKPLCAVLCPCMTSFVRQDTGRVVCDLTDKKIRRLAEPGYDIFFLCMLVFSLVGFFFHGVIVGTAEAIAVFILWLLYRQSSRRKKREIIQYMESVTLEVNSAGSLAVADFPLPLAVVHLDDGQIIWVRQQRSLMTGEIGIFLYDGNAYLKQLVAHEETLALHSLNAKYADIVISPELPLRVLGKVMSK